MCNSKLSAETKAYAIDEYETLSDANSVSIDSLTSQLQSVAVPVAHLSELAAATLVYFVQEFSLCLRYQELRIVGVHQT